ncbi:SusC/RagA family TonB-linked outer membrane protein [Bacteroides maternus]|uniref:SusC/RagA family TonB-linked outer membrane protein n=1 Tax=Bacteroides maternus TaxID=3117552 RepID=UPI003CC7A01A
MTHSSAKTLRVSYIGMQTQEVGIKPNVKIIMKPDTEMLEEVMVVAFGTAKKSAFTGSATVVSAEKLEQSQVTSVTDALAGAVPGVTLTSNNGAPGASASIKIRGFSSLNAGNDPLIIVDGAPYSGDLSNINPNDVESMTVLKDAASNALYGARGANGVIIITTKRANMSGEAKVTFDAKWGANTRALKKYEVITDPAMYYEMHYGAMKNYYMNQMNMSDQAAWIEANNNLFGSNGGLGYNVFTVPEGQYLIGQNGKLNPYATLGRIVNYKGRDYLLTPDDWDKVGSRTGLRQEYNFSISAANEKSSFYVSLGYLGNEGITEGSDLKRLTGRLKADYQAKKWMKVGANMSYARFDSNSLGNNGSSSSTANVWAFTTQMAPIYPAYVRNADGSIMLDGNGLEMMDYGSGINAGMQRPFIADANPIQDNKLNTRNAEGNALSGNAFVDITPLPGLKVTLNGTFNLDETRFTYVYNPYYGQFDSTGGTVSKSHQRDYDYNLQQLVSYATSFGDNNFDILLGHEYYDYRLSYLGASKSKMFSQDNHELDGAVIDGQAASSYKRRRNNEGYFGRLQYNFEERIFGSASLRRDASSRFHPDYRWGTFWSVGGAWLINKESWFYAPWVQELKIKASIGSQGNDNIGDFRYTDVFDIINSDNKVGTAFYSKGTKDITWETNTNFNIGAEFQLWNRVTGSIEYYRRKTSDMLFSFSVAPSLGYSSYFDNVGNMVNSGVEMDFNVNILNTRNFTWDVNLNISTLKNRLTMLDPDKQITTEYTASGKGYKGYSSGNYFIAEDLSMFTWRMKEYAGVDEKGESLWYRNTKDEEGNVVGRETTKTYADADYYVTEESSIPKVYGGFGTKLKVYGVDFGINFTYQIGGKQYDGTYAYFMSSPSGTAGYNYHKDLLKSWTPENTGSNIPRFQLNDQYSAAASTRFLTNASFLNIQNINVGYTLPSRWTKKMAISSLRLYMSAENVFYWSKRQGFDPRQSYNETTNATYYSPMRTISGGVTFEF